MNVYTAADVRSARSFLFVPGNRPERFDKAASSGADIVVIDLEDAVAPPESSLRANMPGRGCRRAMRP